MRTAVSTIILLAATMLGGCDRTGTETVPVATAVTSSPPVGSPPSTSIDPTAGADDLLAANDRAIADNKRMIAVLGDYQKRDFAKYERLRVGCEAKVNGTLADAAAPAVAACIEAGW